MYTVPPCYGVKIRIIYFLFVVSIQKPANYLNGTWETLASSAWTKESSSVQSTDTKNYQIQNLVLLFHY